MESRLEIEQLQQQWDKNCCFCGRFNSEVMVICEGRCLICRVCMKAPNIRRLLVLTAEEAVIRNARKRCPICDNPLARNTVISVQTQDNRTLCDGISLQAGFRPVVNPLLFYYKRVGIDIVLDTECNSILQDQPSWKSLMQKCSNLLVAMEGAPQGRMTPQLMMEYIADVYCAVYNPVFLIHRAVRRRFLMPCDRCTDFSQKKKKKRPMGSAAAAAAADAAMVANALVMSVVSSRNVNLDAIAESINQGSVTSYATQGLVNNITGNGRKSRDGASSAPTAGGLDAVGSSHVSSNSNTHAGADESSANHLLNSIDGSAANDVPFFFSIQQGHFNGTRVCKLKPALEVLIPYLHIFMGNSQSNQDSGLKKSTKLGGVGNGTKQSLASVKGGGKVARLPGSSAQGGVGGGLMRTRSNTAISKTSTFSGNSGANQNSASGFGGQGERRVSFAGNSDLGSVSNSLANSSTAVINAPPVNPLMIAETNCRFYHFALYARILGIFPVPLAIDRPAVCNIATTILVHATHPKVSLKEASDGRAVLFADGTNPQPKDIQDVLLGAITGVSSSAVVRFGCVSTKRAITLLESLALGSVDPLWAMLPYQSQCAELGTAGPWSTKSLSKLLLVLLLRSSAASPGGMGTSVCYSGRRMAGAGDATDMKAPGNAHEASLTSLGQASESSTDGGSDSKSRSMVIAMHETLSHLTELWTGAPLQYSRKATTHELMLKNARNPRATPKQSVFSSSSNSSEATSAFFGNNLNIILQRRRHLKDTLLSMPPGKSNIVHQLVDVEKLKRGFTDWSDVIKPIDFKTARGVAGLCVIDVALFAYICVEAWVLEVNSIEARISDMRNISNRKLAMTLSSFDPSHCRELSVSEKMCMVDIINRFIKDQKDRLQFYTKSKKIDCFEAVEYVCRNVDWFEMKRAQRLRIQAQEGNGSSSHASDLLPHVDDTGVSSRPPTRDGIDTESKINDVSSAANNQKHGSTSVTDAAPHASVPNVPLPADSPVLRSLLDMTDAELTHYTVELGKSFIKRDIWASLMSEATGWKDVFNWVPTIMTGGGAKEVAILRDNKISAKQALAYYEHSRRNDDKYIRWKNIEDDAAAGEKRFILRAEEVDYDCTDSEDEREAEAQKQKDLRRSNNMRRNRQRVVRPAAGASLGVGSPGAVSASEAVENGGPAMSFPGLENCPKPSLEGLGLMRQHTPEFVRRAQSLQDGLVRRQGAVAAHYRSLDDGDAVDFDEPMYLMDPYILDVVRNWVMWSSKTFEPVQFIKKLNAWAATQKQSIALTTSTDAKPEVVPSTCSNMLSVDALHVANPDVTVASPWPRFGRESCVRESAGSEEDASQGQPLMRDEYAVAAFASTTGPRSPKQTSNVRLIPFESPVNSHLPMSVGKVYEPHMVVQLSSLAQIQSEKELVLSQLKRSLPSVSQSVSLQRSRKRLATNNANSGTAERGMSISQTIRIPRSPGNVKGNPSDLHGQDHAQDDRSDGEASDDAGDEDEETKARKYIKYSSKKLERSIVAALGEEAARKYLRREDVTSSKTSKVRYSSYEKDNVTNDANTESGFSAHNGHDSEHDEARDTISQLARSSISPITNISSYANDPFVRVSTNIANLSFAEAAGEESVAPTVVNNVLFRNVIDPYTGLPMRQALTYNRTASSAYGYIDILSNDSSVLSTVRALVPLKSSVAGNDKESMQDLTYSHPLGTTTAVSMTSNIKLPSATAGSTPLVKELSEGSVSVDEHITRKPFDGVFSGSVDHKGSTFSIGSSVSFSRPRSEARLEEPVLAAMQRLTVGAEETFDLATTVAGGANSDASNSQYLQVPKQLLGEGGEDDGTAAVMFRAQAPNRVYDRRAIDLGHYNRLRASEMPYSAGQALRSMVPTSSDGGDSLHTLHRQRFQGTSASKSSLALATALGVSTLEDQEGIDILKLRESKIKYQGLRGLFERYFGELIYADVGHDDCSVDGDASRNSASRRMDRDTDGESFALGRWDDGSNVKSGGQMSLHSGSNGTRTSTAISTLLPDRVTQHAVVVSASPQQVAAMRRLRVLDLHGSALDRRSVELLCNYLSIGCNVEELYLGSTGCTETSAARILNGVIGGKGEQHLVKLDLQDNEILINSISFNAALQRMKGIKLLNLSSNRFHAQSEIAKKSLVSCIKALDVAVLSMARIRLTDAGAAHLLSRLAGHRSLRVLDLANTLVTSACEPQIVAFLKSTPQLRCLLLHGLIMADTGTRRRLEAAAAAVLASSDSTVSNSSRRNSNSSSTLSIKDRGIGKAFDGMRGVSKVEDSNDENEQNGESEESQRMLILDGRYDGIDLTY